MSIDSATLNHIKTEMKNREKIINKLIEEYPIEGFGCWLRTNWGKLTEMMAEGMPSYIVPQEYLTNSNLHRLAAQTAKNMAGVILSDEFEEWLVEHWEEIENRCEFEEIMDYYLHGDY